jgi:hypothetical protein
MLKKQKPTFNPARFNSNKFKSLTESIHAVCGENKKSLLNEQSPPGKPPTSSSAGGGPAQPGFNTPSTSPAFPPKINPVTRQRGRGRSNPKTLLPYYSTGLGIGMGASKLGRVLSDADQIPGGNFISRLLLPALGVGGTALISTLLGPLGVPPAKPTMGTGTPSPRKSFPKTF